MPAAVAVPLISAGIGAAASLGGAAMGSSAAKDAARLQAEQAQKALDEQKRIRDLQTQQRQPYLDAGYGALQRMQQISQNGKQMALPAAYGPGSQNQMYQQALAAKNGSTLPGIMSQLGQSTPLGAFGSDPSRGAPTGPQPQPSSPDQTIIMQAPNGQTRQVPASEQQHWESLGARRIG